jgi:Methyltransferase domain
MKAIDRYLQTVRINKAKKYIRKNDTVLDIGSADGAMLESCRGLIKSGVGIEPLLPAIVKTDFYTLLPGYFPDACADGITYDVITMLAVLEHIPPHFQETLAGHCHNLLNKNGRLIVTVPSPQVDFILNILKQLKLIDGMRLEEHYGFKPELTKQLFSDGYFRLLHNQQFQLGWNNLFVFEKID